tara:strand:+ start:12474 stop:12743 length:270 start_codon:yes stop_codon:yes gene_type:complete
MKLGETSSEKDVKRIQESRDIVKTIINYGVNEDHKLDILYFLSLELENRSALEDITKILKKYRSGIKPDEESQYDEEEPDSKSNKLLGV